MAPTPKLPTSLREALALPGAFKWYFTERFGTRQWLTGLHGGFELRVLRTSPSSAVVLGDSGWLFLASERVLDYHRHADPLSPQRVEEWARVLGERQQELASKGIKHAFVVAPNKHSIYPEHLPSDMAPPAATTRLDQLLEATKRLAPGVELVDLRPALVSQKHELPLFFKTDTHWTATGSWVASQYLARRLGLPAPPAPLLPLRIRETSGGDLARLMGLARELSEQDVWPAAAPVRLSDEQGDPVTWKLMDVSPRDRVVALNPTGRGTAVVFRDSFGEALIPWVSGMFARTVWIWSYDYSEEIVDEEQPDVVLEVIVERKLMVISSPGGGTDE